jgi:hypothetical protein
MAHDVPERVEEAIEDRYESQEQADIERRQ